MKKNISEDMDELLPTTPDFITGTVEHSCRIELAMSAEFEGVVSQEVLLSQIRSSIKSSIKSALQSMAEELRLTSTSVQVTPIVIECSTVDESDDFDEYDMRSDGNEDMLPASVDIDEPGEYDEDEEEGLEEEDDEASGELVAMIEEGSEIPDYEDAEEHSEFEEAYGETHPGSVGEEEDEEDEEEEDEEEEDDDEEDDEEEEEEEEEEEDYQS